MLSLFLPEQINISKVKALEEITPGAPIAPVGYTRGARSTYRMAESDLGFHNSLTLRDYWGRLQQWLC